MWGRVAVVGIAVVAAIAGGLLYYMQVFAFYTPVAFTPGAEILLTPLADAPPEPIVADNVTGIDADSSPLRFRACFATPLSLALLTETYRTYPTPEPLNAPGWFDCFDAATIGAALESGEALAFLGQENITYGIDRVIAVFPDGRGYAWHQINRCGEAVFNGDAPPADCPAPDTAP